MVPFCPHHCQLLLFADLLMIATSMKWFLPVVLMCTSLMTAGGEPLIMGLLAICISSLEKMSFWVICPFWGFFFLILCCASCLYILDINSYQSYQLQIFYPIYLTVLSFCWWFLLLLRSFLTFIWSHLLILLLFILP